MNPILKYTGGKRREIPFFKKYFPEKYDRYVEPFFGGGAVFFYLEPKESIINDKNTALMDFYKNIAFNKENLIKELDTMQNQEDFYYRIRDMLNGKIKKTYSSAAIYAYMNRTAYSGMIRYNSKGEFNVPYGRYKMFHPQDFITEEASKLLRETEILSADFEEIFNQLSAGDFVFLDPPYDSTFTSYIPDGFTTEDHKRLATMFKKTEAKCLLVIGDTDFIRNLYDGYIVDKYDKTYSINIKNRMAKNNHTDHLIIKNY